MKNWAAYLELKKQIDDFNECCPLLESLANKALIDRHWEQVATLCGCKFDIHNENFLLRNIMEAPLLQYKEVSSYIWTGLLSTTSFLELNNLLLIAYSMNSVQF